MDGWRDGYIFMHIRHNFKLGTARGAKLGIPYNWVNHMGLFKEKK